MKINQLLEFRVEEDAARMARIQQLAQANKARRDAEATGAPNLTVQTGGKGSTAPTATPKFGTGTSMPLNPVTVPGASSKPSATVQSVPGTTSTPASSQPAQTSMTGDPTLDQPLAPATPKDPNAPGIGTRIGRGVGQVAKGVGAVAGGVAGIGRALKKGYQAGANTVGGPGAASASAPASGSAASIAPTSGGAASGGSSSAVSDQEFNDLMARVQKLEQLARIRT